MKKCPKCGTVLDDSKKKCYMCGADLTASASVNDFSSNFDEKIGSSVTRGVDNVFNNGRDIDVDSSDMVGGKNRNNGSFFSHSSSSRDFFGGEINKLNSMHYNSNSENKSKTGLFGKKEFKSKDEVNDKKKDNNDGKVKKISYSTNPNIPKEMKESIQEKKQESPVSGNMFFAGKEEEKSKVIKSDLLKDESKDDVPEAFKDFNSFKNKDKKEAKSAFDKFVKDGPRAKKDDSKRLSKEQVNSAFAMFNNNKNDYYNNDNDVEVDFFNKKKESTGNQTDFSGLKMPKEPNAFDKFRNNLVLRGRIQLKEAFRMGFNLICVVGFVVLLVFVYFKFIKIDTVEQLDGLQYKVPKYFKLNRTDTHEKFYVSKEKGNVCSFEVISGIAPDPNGYVENYFQYVRSLYASEPKAVPTMQEMKINGNTWKSEKIIFLPENGEEVSAASIIPRYSFTTIVYNGSFYTIRFTNTNEDEDCNKQLSAFMNTVSFIESNVKQ